MTLSLFPQEYAAEYHTEQASTLPELLRFGTSTWTYEGWKGLLYHQHYASNSAFTRESLAEYAQFPWFRTVGVDNTFYRPPTVSTLKRYAEQTPPQFQWVSKVWEHITTPKFPRHPRYGSRGGSLNQTFLDPQLFRAEVLSVYEKSGTLSSTGPLVFQFPFIAKQLLSSEEFFQKLEYFFSALPGEFRYAVEVRNPEYLCEQYFNLLQRHNVTHCFNHWTGMPAPLEQMKSAALAGGLTADFFVARMLTPLGVPYKDAVERFSPYSELKTPCDTARNAMVTLAKRALQTNKPAFVIVNNRLEGHAPLTIVQTALRILESLEQPS